MKQLAITTEGPRPMRVLNYPGDALVHSSEARNSELREASDPALAAVVAAMDRALRQAAAEQLAVAVVLVSIGLGADPLLALGPAGAQRLMRAALQALRAGLPAATKLLPLGCDRIAVLSPSLAGCEAAELFASRALAAIDRRLDVGGELLWPGPRIGLACSTGEGIAAEALLHDAAGALARALAGSRGHSTAPAGPQAAAARMHLLSDLAEAIDLGQLHLAYQPQVDLPSGRVNTVEALMRWHHPQRGYVPPGQFVPMAELAGLMPAMTKWALWALCQDIRQWQRRAVRPQRYALNVGPDVLADPDMVQWMLDTLRTQDVSPQHLEIELTEGPLVEASSEALIAGLAALRAAGVSIAVDDFGAGSTCLSQLQVWPVDRLKLDRSLLKQAHLSTAVLRAVIRLAGALGLPVVAEGVEDAGQLDLVSALGCSAAQGYLFSAVLPFGMLADSLGRAGGVMHASLGPSESVAAAA